MKIYSENNDSSHISLNGALRLVSLAGQYDIKTYTMLLSLNDKMSQIA